MFRRTAIKLIGVATLLAGVGVAGEARAADVIKIGTLAPASGPWGQAFKAWAEAVKQKSGGRVELQISYNGQQGDEAAMVGKIKQGQLDGALLSAVGLGNVYRPILALQMPGLFRTWAKLDAARSSVNADFEKGAKDAGFDIVGWADVGNVRAMSRGFELHTPDDLKGKKPWMLRDDRVQPILFEVVGGVTPVPLGVPEVLPQLNAGGINVVIAPALAAEQLQWASKLDAITDDISGLAIGGLVLSSKRLDALPADLRDIVRDQARVAAATLQARLRTDDEASFTRLKGRMKVVALSADEKAKWDALYKQVRARLSKGTFAPELVAKLEALAK